MLRMRSVAAACSAVARGPTPTLRPLPAMVLTRRLTAHRRLSLSTKNRPNSSSRFSYATPAIPETTVESWSMNEFKYYDIPSPFPTLARGLFSVKEENAEKDGRVRIKSSQEDTTSFLTSERFRGRWYDCGASSLWEATYPTISVG
jgi:hypothetical protein